MASEKRERVEQKARTRQDLIRSALRMLERGDVPTMPSVAAEAGVSRGTVYRFFPNQQLLLAEALRAFSLSLEVQRDFSDKLSNPDDLEARIRLLCDLVYKILARNEASFRTFLRYTLEKGDTTPAQRRVRGRFLWVDLALQPAAHSLTAPKLARFRIQLAALLGIESFITYRDVCELSLEESTTMAADTAVTLLRQALAAPSEPPLATK